MATWPYPTLIRLFAIASYETKTRRFSRPDYEWLIELGVFKSGDEIGLIAGQSMDAGPQGAANYTAVVTTARALVTAFGAGWCEAHGGAIDVDNEPEPGTERLQPRSFFAADPDRRCA